MTEKVFTNIISSSYVRKIDKFIIELGIKGESKIKVWLTQKQMINLENCFNQTPKGYSNGDISVIGVFNDNGYYSYSKVIRHERERLFNIPIDYDLNDLQED